MRIFPTVAMYTVAKVPWRASIATTAASASRNTTSAVVRICSCTPVRIAPRIGSGRDMKPPRDVAAGLAAGASAGAAPRPKSFSAPSFIAMIAPSSFALVHRMNLSLRHRQEILLLHELGHVELLPDASFLVHVFAFHPRRLRALRPRRELGRVAQP